MATQTPIDEARYDAGRLNAQADALEARAEALREEARELVREAVELRAAANQRARAHLEVLSLAAHQARANGQDPFLARVEAVLDGAGPLSMSDLTDHLNQSPTRVRAALLRLEEAGKIKRSGIKRGTRYELAGEGDDDQPPPKVREFRSYEGVVRDAAVKLQTFELVDLQRELPDLSEATLRRWVRRLEDKGIFQSERVGVTKIYAYVPHEAGPTHRPRSAPPEVEVRRLAGPERRRGDVVAGTRVMRTGSSIVNELLRDVRPYGVEVKRTSHKIVFIGDNGQEIAHCSSTPGASSLKKTRAQLRKAGVPV